MLFACLPLLLLLLPLLLACMVEARGSPAAKAADLAVVPFVVDVASSSAEAAEEEVVDREGEREDTAARRATSSARCTASRSASCGTPAVQRMAGGTGRVREQLQQWHS